MLHAWVGGLATRPADAWRLGDELGRGCDETRHGWIWPAHVSGHLGQGPRANAQVQRTGVMMQMIDSTAGFGRIVRVHYVHGRGMVMGDDMAS